MGHMRKNKNCKGTHGFEPWAYRTAADCSTTELYPQLYVSCHSGVPRVLLVNTAHVHTDNPGGSLWHFFCDNAKCDGTIIVGCMYKRRWYNGQHSCLPSSWSGFDSRPTQFFYLISGFEPGLVGTSGCISMLLSELIWYMYWFDTRTGSRFSWCSGYHICLTHRRSPVRSRAKTAVPRGLTARISGFHPGGPGSTPGVGILF